MSTNLNILYIGSPYYHHNRERFTKKITKILSHHARKLCVVGANEPISCSSVVWIESIIEQDKKGLVRYYKFLQKQLESIAHPKIRTFDYDVIIVRPSSYIIPVLYNRILSCPEVTIVTQVTRNPLQNILTKLNFEFSKGLIVETKSVAGDWNADRHWKKIFEGPTYVDSLSYWCEAPYSTRDLTVGYVGMLDKRKGVDKFLPASQDIIEGNSGIELRIGGTGPLQELTVQYANKTDGIEYLGFIDQSDMLEFYNGLQLLVLPTNSEGLPNVALEAMACGTPVLATPVGGLPDIIEDGETGFLMEDNDPETIRENVKRALSHPNREQISANARELIEEEYRFESAVKRYERILEELT